LPPIGRALRKHVLYVVLRALGVSRVPRKNDCLPSLVT
jgi:hypothetical protein